MITNKALEMVRQNLAHMNLAGRVDVNACVLVTFSLFNDIFRSRCRISDDTEVAIAVKCVRISLKDNLPLAKVRFYSLYTNCYSA